MAEWKRPALCRICEGPVVDGGCRMDQLDLEKVSEWWRCKLGAELDLDDLKEAEICHFCIFEARLEQEHVDGNMQVDVSKKCDWWTGHDTSIVLFQNIFRDELICPCKVVLENVDLTVEVKKKEQLLSAGDYVANNSLRCIFCHSLFRSNLSLHTHVTGAHSSARKCFSCNIYFLCSLDREQHFEEVHAETPSKCIYCEENFNNKNVQFRKHMEDFHSDLAIWRCSNGHCKKEFFTEFELNNHFSRAHHKISEKQFECIYVCKETFFKTFRSLSLHLKKKHKGQFFRCDYKQRCASFFKNKKDLADHVQNAHEINFTTVKRIKCLYCYRKIICGQLQNHVKEYHKGKRVIRCRYVYCTTYFGSDQEQQEHEAQAHSLMAKGSIPNGSKICRICQMVVTRCNMRRHVRINHKNESISICKYYLCDYYGSAKEVQNHCRDKHESGASKMKCVYCGFFYTKEGFWTHVNYKHKSQAIKCPFPCREYFLSEQDRDEHIIKVHSKAPMLREQICIYCKKSFYYKGNIKQHMREVHKNNYIGCSLRGCCEYFLSQSDKDKHYLEIHQEKEATKLLKCLKCNYKTGSIKNLSDHTERQHGTTKVTCPKCSVVFRSKISLNVHELRVHQRQRQNCKHCKHAVLNLRLHQRWMECENCQIVTHCIVKARQHKAACMRK